MKITVKYSLKIKYMKTIVNTLLRLRLNSFPTDEKHTRGDSSGEIYLEACQRRKEEKR